jgi:FMN hydrolase / 5-amino-6-(5-phospho-D-ribitylamino)uracil phosphatase
MPETSERWVCLDVGETLIDETRIWSIWADELRIPRLTLFAAIGAVIAREGEHRDIFQIFGVDDWPMRIEAVESLYGGFQPHDLYPDALRALDGLRAAGYRLAVLANQPAARSAELRALGVTAEVIAMSEELGVAKPDAAFFARALELMGGPARGDVAYVGDRVDNDVVPTMAAGLQSVWLRRGPWGIIQRLPDGERPALVVDSLDELVGRIGEAWG